MRRGRVPVVFERDELRDVRINPGLAVQSRGSDAVVPILDVVTKAELVDDNRRQHQTTLRGVQHTLKALIPARARTSPVAWLEVWPELARSRDAADDAGNLDRPHTQVAPGERTGAGGVLSKTAHCSEFAVLDGLRVHEQDGAARQPRHLVCDAADQYGGQAWPDVGAQDDEVGANGVRLVDDGARHWAASQNAGGWYTGRLDLCHDSIEVGPCEGLTWSNRARVERLWRKHVEQHDLRAHQFRVLASHRDLRLAARSLIERLQNRRARSHRLRTSTGANGLSARRGHSFFLIRMDNCIHCPCRSVGA